MEKELQGFRMNRIAYHYCFSGKLFDFIENFVFYKNVYRCE